jgi:hypothetical protein
VRVQETPEIIGQKQKLVTIKGSLKASVQALSKQLVTIHTDLDAASNMEELLEITRTLKALKENFINYTKNKTAAQEEKQPLSARRYLPGSICKSAVEAGHTSLQGKPNWRRSDAHASNYEALCITHKHSTIRQSSVQSTRCPKWCRGSAYPPVTRVTRVRFPVLEILFLPLHLAKAELFLPPRLFTLLAAFHCLHSNPFAPFYS